MRRRIANDDAPSQFERLRSGSEGPPHLGEGAAPERPHEVVLVHLGDHVRVVPLDVGVVRLDDAAGLPSDWRRRLLGLRGRGRRRRRGNLVGDPDLSTLTEHTAIVLRHNNSADENRAK